MTATEVAHLLIHLTGDATNYIKMLATVESASKTTFEKIQAFATTLSAGIGVPLATAMGLATKQFAGFEKQIAMIKGIVGESDDQVAKWSDQLLRMAPKVAKSPEELAHALYFASSAGLETEKVMNLVWHAARGAASGLGKTDDVARLLIVALNTFSDEGMTAAKALDILTAAVGEGNHEAHNIVMTISKALPVAKALGVSFEEVAGTMAVLSREGAPATEAVTNIQSMLSALMGPSSDGARAIKQLGLSFNQLREVVQEKGGLVKAFRMIDEAAKGNMETVKTLVPNMRAMRGAYNLLTQDAKKTQEALDAVRNSTGRADKAFSETAKTVAFRFAAGVSQLQVTMIRLGQSVGQAILPIFEMLIEGVRQFTRWWVSLEPATRTVVMGFLTFAALSGPVMLLFLFLTTQVRMLIRIFTLLLVPILALEHHITHLGLVFYGRFFVGIKLAYGILSLFPSLIGRVNISLKLFSGWGPRIVANYNLAWVITSKIFHGWDLLVRGVSQGLKVLYTLFTTVGTVIRFTFPSWAMMMNILKSLGGMLLTAFRRVPGMFIHMMNTIEAALWVAVRSIGKAFGMIIPAIVQVGLTFNLYFIRMLKLVAMAMQAVLFHPIRTLQFLLLGLVRILRLVAIPLAYLPRLFYGIRVGLVFATRYLLTFMITLVQMAGVIVGTVIGSIAQLSLTLFLSLNPIRLVTLAWKGLLAAFMIFMGPTSTIIFTILKIAGVLLVLTQKVGGVQNFFNLAIEAVRNFWHWILPVRQALMSLFKVIIEVGYAALVHMGEEMIHIGEVIAEVLGFAHTDWEVTWQSIMDTVVDVLLTIEFGLRNTEAVGAMVWTGIQYYFVSFSMEVVHFFSQTLPYLLGWFGRNWYSVFETAYSFATSVFMNLGENAANLIAKIWLALSGEDVDWTEGWKPMLDGFKNTIQEALEIPPREIGQMEEQLKQLYESQKGELGQSLEEFKKAMKDKFASADNGGEDIMDWLLNQMSNMVNKSKDKGEESGAAFGRGLDDGVEASIFGSAEGFRKMLNQSVMQANQVYQKRKEAERQAAEMKAAMDREKEANAPLPPMRVDTLTNESNDTLKQIRDLLQEQNKKPTLELEAAGVGVA